MVAELVRDFHAPVPDLVDVSAPEQIGEALPVVLPELGRWAVGRVALVGDAARAASPGYARGAGEALVDAHVLADLLRDHPRDVVGRLWEYQRRRQRAAEALRKQAAQLDRVAAWDGAVRVRVRNAVMKRAVGRRARTRVDRELEEIV